MEGEDRPVKELLVKVVEVWSLEKSKEPINPEDPSLPEDVKDTTCGKSILEILKMSVRAILRSNSTILIPDDCVSILQSFVIEK